MRVIACGSPYGKGGVGQHFAQLVEESREAGALARYYAPAIKQGDEEKGRSVSLKPFRRMNALRWCLPASMSQSWSSQKKGDVFDRVIASCLTRPEETFMGFVGKTLRSFRRARQVGYKELELVAVNSHVNNLKRLHEQARRQLKMESSWLNEAQRTKTLREYELADTIYVHSEYTRQSFIEAGIEAAKLKRTYLRPASRFVPPAVRPDDGVFRVVYIGRLDATKGIPLLMEAFSRLRVGTAELTLVGGWSTRSMRRIVEEWMRRDERIRLAPGDPLPALHRADVLVHPTYEDGFGYAPVEALACGVPVVVTADTGMKELVQEGVNGYVVPTGDWQALLERMEHVARYPLVSVRSGSLEPSFP
ncbi:MAG TPA: glycosyltransferase family 4 protein [Rhodothermales bacterium]|nr:glycosyltransferase family 4 protein [Rhodothermales bacterium]